MKEQLHQFSRFICSPTVLKKDEGLTLRLDRNILFDSAQYRNFSKAVNTLPNIANLVEARSKASNAQHGDIARGITEEAISYCWKRSRLNPESLEPCFEKQLEQLKVFKGSGFLPISMAILLPIGIEERIELSVGTLEPLSESTLRHFKDLIEDGAPSWLDHGRGKAVLLTKGNLSYAELIEGNLSRGPDHNDHYGLLLLQLATIIHYLTLGRDIPSLEPEMACQSGAISGGIGFSKNTQHHKPQLKIAKGDMTSIAKEVEILASNKFPHFPARRFVEALTRNRSQEDRLVDCVTGWEGVLMPGEKNELGFRLSLTLALLLDENGSGVEIPTQVRRIYGIRSQIVHGDFKQEVKGKKGLTGQLKYEIELRRACFEALVLTKKLLRHLINNPAVIGIGSEKVTNEIITKLFRRD